jgi:hypothetical protein
MYAQCAILSTFKEITAMVDLYVQNKKDPFDL